MKNSLAVAVLLASLLPATAFAQRVGPDVIGVDFQVAFPVGDFTDGAGVGFGGLLRYEFTIATATNITARAGFMYHLPKDLASPEVSIPPFYTFPLLLGVKVRLTQSAYIAADAGTFINTPEVSPRIPDVGGFDAAFGFTVGLGWRFSSVDLRIGAEMVDAGYPGGSIALTIGLGYDF